MTDLPAWLRANAPALIQAASVELSPDERLRASVAESVEAFYDGLFRSAQTGSVVPLHAILIDWVEARSAPTDEEPAGLLPVLATLKRVTWQHIVRVTPPEEAVPLLIETEALFT